MIYVPSPDICWGHRLIFFLTTLFAQEVVKASQLVDSNTLLHQAAVYTCKQQGIKVELPVYK